MMFTGWLPLLGVLALHLARVNSGSRTPTAAFAIADITLAQACYGRLPAHSSDYYTCTAAPATTARLSLLVPAPHYAAGFAPTITLHGPGLPAEGLRLEPGDYGTRQGTTFYQRTQRAEPTLAGGSYTLAISSALPGVYCFCVGSREPTDYADAATRARVQALLATAPLT